MKTKEISRTIQSRVKVVAILCFWVHTIGRSSSGGFVAIVAVPIRFAMICWVVLEAFVGQIHVLGWPYIYIIYIYMYTLFAEVVPAYLAYMGETSLWSFLLHTSVGWEGRSFSLFGGSGWSRGAVAVPHFMLRSMMALGLAFDNS